MTAITEQLCARCLASPPPEACDKACSLADLRRGIRGTILGFTAELDPHIARRLFDLGFVPGADAELLRKAPLRDPLMFRVAGTEIVLRRHEARHVLIAA
ncbi:FeoA family protein [Propionicicella superfundia]|uniref:FeoA family protein n=1 Tax=Propionicicella superfundia TaxID=348582 RepID=UPI000401E4AF|nr:FeoA family protein [Propionicicella superfundia]